MQNESSPSKLRPSMRRKPVPPYIPSPAAASPMSLSSREISSKHLPDMHKDVPPLPADWEQRVQQALMYDELRINTNGTAPTAGASSSNGHVKPKTVKKVCDCAFPPLICSSVLFKSPSGTVKHDSDPPTPSASPVQRQIRQKPRQEYRPPTPPLQASHDNNDIRTYLAPPMVRSITNRTNSTFMSPPQIQRTTSSYISINSSLRANTHQNISFEHFQKVPSSSVVHEIQLSAPEKRSTLHGRCQKKASLQLLRETRKEKSANIPRKHSGWFRKLGAAVGLVFH